MSCRLILDPGPFYPGSEVRGRLECDFRKSEKIRGIKIRTTGDEHTEWTRTENHYDEVAKRYETITIPCNGDVNLFNFEIMLFGGGQEVHVGPGVFNYPFSFQLPANLPSTFMNDYGHITYLIKGIIDIPWGLDYTDKAHYEVLSLVDLNTFPMECFQPVSRSDNKTVCCWCCRQGDITLDININKTAFVPGESVKLYMTLTNMSNSNVEGVSAKFMQYVRSKVEHPSHEHKEDEFEFGYRTWSGVGAHGENKYDMELPIPLEAPYPNLNRSSLFEISYDVEICAVIDGCHSNMDLSFSVEIGHIQHQSQIDMNVPPTGPNAPGYLGRQPRSPSPLAGFFVGPNDENGLPNWEPIPGYPYEGMPPMPQEGPSLRVPSALPTPSSPPDYRSVYPGGPPEMSAKEKESFGEKPSAPPSTEELPPSYEDASKNAPK